MSWFSTLVVKSKVDIKDNFHPGFLTMWCQWLMYEQNGKGDSLEDQILPPLMVEIWYAHCPLVHANENSHKTIRINKFW